MAPTSTVVVDTSTSPIWPSSHSAPLATHWLIPLRTDSKPDAAMEPPMLPTWQTGLRASRPVQPAASISGTGPDDQCRLVPVWKKKFTIGGAAPIRSAARPDTNTARRPTSDCW